MHIFTMPITGVPDWLREWNRINYNSPTMTRDALEGKLSILKRREVLKRREDACKHC